MKMIDKALCTARRASHRFARDESGVATIFACFMIMMMVLVGGIGVDLMHNEMERTRLQNTLDRAVLAAADREQPLDPKAVVADYLAKSNLSEHLHPVDVNEEATFRIVTASATTASPTQFLHLMGVDELRVPALSRAEEHISKVEVSLILDVSGSMAAGSKMDNLQSAAKAFINALIKPSTQDLISISLVPYSEHVNVGQGIYDQLTTNNRHNYSYCVEIPDEEFETTLLDTSLTYDQAQHFQWNSVIRTHDENGVEVDPDNLVPEDFLNVIDDTVCPKEEFESIHPLSQSITDLEADIDLYTPRAGTSIFMAVKWGTALLDPSTRSIVDKLIDQNYVDGSFSGRPAEYSDPETLKTMVVMSDGKNDRSSRIAEWAYDSVSEYVNWNTYNFWYFMNNFVPSAYHDFYYWEKYNAEKGDELTAAICKAARDNGIEIWSVGFEVDSHGESILRDCASSPTHYFGVEGVEIKEAFKAIASQINQLRLTQ